MMNDANPKFAGWKIETGKPPKTFGENRDCIVPSCQTKLSRYNPSKYCSIHVSSYEGVERL